MFPVSWLFTPGSRPDRFIKATLTTADALILDLEDAVSEAGKPEARANVIQFLDCKPQLKQKICVRINSLTRKHGLEDLAALSAISCPPDFLLLPKCENAADLALVDSVLTDQLASTKLLALVETAKGISRAPELARATPRLTSLFFGAADYAADLGLQVSTFEPDFARQSLVNAAASGGITAIDSPFFQIDDHEAHARECRRSRSFGFSGKAAIHPSQVVEIGAAFCSTIAEKDLARQINAAAPNGVGVLDGKMIDIAMVRWARRVAD